MYDAKESELDILKHCGDDISQKGNSSLVEPFEQQIYKRWDELERKIKFVGSTLEMKLKEIEKSEDPPPEKRRIIEEQEEVGGTELHCVLPTSLNITHRHQVYEKFILKTILMSIAWDWLFIVSKIRQRSG